MNTDGSAQTNLTNDGVFDYGPDWSPDSAEIAFTRIVAPEDDGYEIYDERRRHGPDQPHGQTQQTRSRRAGRRTGPRSPSRAAGTAAARST